MVYFSPLSGMRIFQPLDLNFLASIYSLTLVPPEKQSLVFKGKTLKDEESYKTFGQSKFTNGALVGLIGTAEGTSKVDLDKIEQKVFVEDLTNEEKAKYLKENYNVSSR